MRAGLLVSIVLAVVACGATESGGSDSGSGGMGQAGLGNAAGTSPTAGSGGSGRDCSNVGCGAPPLCETGCEAPCGCCPCGDGQIMDRAGTSYICQGGCYAELDQESVEWTQLQISNGWGPCPDDNCYSQWRVWPDGSVNTLKQGTQSVAVMSAADLVALEAIIAEPAFLEGMTQGFSCEPPPTDVGYELRLEQPDGAHVQVVTGCVLTGPAGNPAQRVAELLSTY